MYEDTVNYSDYDYDPFLEYGHGGWETLHIYKDASSVQVGELVEVGWLDLSDKEVWHWPIYNEQQDDALRDKIINHFWNRSLGILPAGLWKRQFIEKMNEIMPKYLLMYAALNEDGNIPGHNSEWYKSRNIFSDFPQTQLSGNSDYASTGNDTEYERIRQADILDTLNRLKDYQDIDVMILNDLEEMFSCLISVSINTR